MLFFAISAYEISSVPYNHAKNIHTKITEVHGSNGSQMSASEELDDGVVPDNDEVCFIAYWLYFMVLISILSIYQYFDYDAKLSRFYFKKSAYLIIFSLYSIIPMAYLEFEF